MPIRKKQATPAAASPSRKYAALLARLSADPAFKPIVAAYQAALAEGPRKFGSNALKVNGRIFAMEARGHLVVKLPKARVDALAASGAGAYFDPGHGRPMKQWISLLSPTLPWEPLVREAHAYGKSGETGAGRPSGRKPKPSGSARRLR